MSTARRLLLTLIPLVLALTFFFGWRASRTWLEPGRAEVASFDPDRVIALTWADHGRAQTVSLTDAPATWAIARAKLEELARVRLVETALPSRPEVTLEIAFDEGARWSASFGDGTFAWGAGARTGAGFRASEDLDAFFREGEYAFRNHKWMWCTSHPRQFEFEVGDHAYGLRESHQGWQAERDGQPARVDSARVDAWIAGACEFEVDRFRDLKAYPMGLDEGRVRFVANFLDGSRWELRESRGTWTIGAQPFAFRSKAWDRAVEDLAKLVD